MSVPIYGVNPSSTIDLLKERALRLKEGQPFSDGRKVVRVAPSAEVVTPPGAEEVDLRGAYVTPGLIDVHSHLGVFASPEVVGTDDGNEATAPITAEVSAEHSFWPQDPQLRRAIAGGPEGGLLSRKAHERARTILLKNRATLEAIAAALIHEESLDRAHLLAIPRLEREDFDRLYELKPFYVRKSDAQIAWDRRRRAG